MITNGYPSYSGIGPSAFNKRQLLEIIKMRSKAGRKARRSYSVSELDSIPRRTLVNEAKRLRGSNTWSHFANMNRVMKHSS